MFPDEIEISVIDGCSNLPVENLAVSIKLFANRKNDYDILSLITNERGIAIYNKEYVKKFIDRTIDLFPMDYSSNLDDCKPVVEIEVLDSDQVKRAIYGMTMWKNAYGIQQKYIDKMLAVENYKYTKKTQKININNQHKLHVEFKLISAQ